MPSYPKKFAGTEPLGDGSRSVLVISFRAAAGAPGTRARELLRPSDVVAFACLPANFRSVLSNLATCSVPLAFGGKTFATLEHAFQAQKFKDVAPAAYGEFSMESGSPLSRGDGFAARAARKRVTLSRPQVAAWDARKDGVMACLWRAKFSALNERAVLLATGGAELWHAAPRVRAVRWTDLEALRDEMRAAGGA